MCPNKQLLNITDRHSPHKTICGLTRVDLVRIECRSSFCFAECYANIIVHFEGPHAYYTPGCPCKNGKHCEVIGNEIPQGPVGT